MLLDDSARGRSPRTRRRACRSPATTHRGSPVGPGTPRHLARRLEALGFDAVTDRPTWRLATTEVGPAVAPSGDDPPGHAGTYVDARLVLDGIAAVPDVAEALRTSGLRGAWSLAERARAGDWDVATVVRCDGEPAIAVPPSRRPPAGPATRGSSPRGHPTRTPPRRRSTAPTAWPGEPRPGPGSASVSSPRSRARARRRRSAVVGELHAGLRVTSGDASGCVSCGSRPQECNSARPFEIARHPHGSVAGCRAAVHFPGALPHERAVAHDTQGHDSGGAARSVPPRRGSRDRPPRSTCDTRGPMTSATVASWAVGRTAPQLATPSAL